MVLFHGTQSPAVFYIQRIIRETFGQRLDAHSCKHLLATLALKPGTDGARCNSYAELCSELRNGAAVELCSGYYPDGAWNPDSDAPDFPCEGSEDAQRRASSPFISLLSDVHKLRATDAQIFSVNSALDHYPLEMVLALVPPPEMDFDVEKAAMFTRKLELGKKWSLEGELLLLGFTAYEDSPGPEIPDGVMYGKTLNGVIASALSRKITIAQWHFARFPNGFARPTRLENAAERIVFTAAFENGNWLPIGWAQGLSVVTPDVPALLRFESIYGMQAERMIISLYDALSKTDDDYRRSNIYRALSSSPVTITALNQSKILLSDPAVPRSELEAALLNSLCHPTPSIRLKTIPHRHTIDNPMVQFNDPFPGHGYTDVAMLPAHGEQSKVLEESPILNPEVIRLYQSRHLVHPSLVF